MHHKGVEAAEVPHEIVDPHRLAGWMDANGFGSGPIGPIVRLGGGTQNVVAAFEREGRRYALRRPPASGRADGSATMLREATVLAGLAGSGVPHPALIGTCSDESVLGVAFYLMEPVDGFNPASAMPAEFRAEPSAVNRLGFAMVDALVALNGVDVTAAPLVELGSKPGWIERQVPRWTRRLEALAAIPDYRPLPTARLDAVREWLDARIPTDERTGLVHGDYTFANVLVDQRRPELTAVIDWELASIGDPRLDVAHFLTSLTMKRVPGLWDLEDLAGLPTADELVDSYTSRTGDDPDGMFWFRVLAGYRLLTLLEETVGRAAAGDAPQKLADMFRRITSQLLDHAETLTLQRN